MATINPSPTTTSKKPLPPPEIEEEDDDDVDDDDDDDDDGYDQVTTAEMTSMNMATFEFSGTTVVMEGKVAPLKEMDYTEMSVTEDYEHLDLEKIMDSFSDPTPSVVDENVKESVKDYVTVIPLENGEINVSHDYGLGENFTDGSGLHE